MTNKMMYNWQYWKAIWCVNHNSWASMTYVINCETRFKLYMFECSWANQQDWSWSSGPSFFIRLPQFHNVGSHTSAFSIKWSKKLPEPPDIQIPEFSFFLPQRTHQIFRADSSLNCSNQTTGPFSGSKDCPHRSNHPKLTQCSPATTRQPLCLPYRCDGNKSRSYDYQGSEPAERF